MSVVIAGDRTIPTRHDATVQPNQPVEVCLFYNLDNDTYALTTGPITTNLYGSLNAGIYRLYVDVQYLGDTTNIGEMLFFRFGNDTVAPTVLTSSGVATTFTTAFNAQRNVTPPLLVTFGGSSYLSSKSVQIEYVLQAMTSNNYLVCDQVLHSPVTTSANHYTSLSVTLTRLT